MTTLSSVSPSSWHSTFEYRLRDTVNNEQIYGLWHINDGVWQSNSSEYSIKVNSSHAWFDNGGNDPVDPVVNGNYIELKNSGGTVLYRFIPPNPPPGGGGTLGGTVYVQDAKIVNYAGLTGLRFEQRGYPVASYELTGTGFTSSWSLTSQSNDLQHHISNLSVGTYYLYQDSLLVATLKARLHVSCNFW